MKLLPKICWVISTASLVAIISFPLQAKNDHGVIGSIVKAPVASDGTTAGRQTDFVINLDTSLNPSVDGRTLLTGRTIKITLPRGFQDTAGLPFGGPGCAPPIGSAGCNTAVLLQGWPQHPIRPPPLKYSFHYEAATNTVVFTALEDLVPAAPLEPGIKQMHLMLLGFTNPHPGHYRVKVEAETGPGGALEIGMAKIQIIPKPRPSINITSTGADNPTTLNTIYQETTAGNMVPLNYNFLLWKRNDEPFAGVDLYPLDDNGNYLLQQGNRVVGHVTIDAPDGAEGQNLTSFGESVVVSTPTIGTTLTARWVGSFTAGDKAGMYTVNAKLNGGNEIKMYVEVTD